MIMQVPQANPLILTQHPKIQVILKVTLIWDVYFLRFFLSIIYLANKKSNREELPPKGIGFRQMKRLWLNPHPKDLSKSPTLVGFFVYPQ